MFYDCSDEFDLDMIYQKLIGKNNPPTILAKYFFVKNNELELLQNKMNGMKHVYAEELISRGVN